MLRISRPLRSLSLIKRLLSGATFLWIAAAILPTAWSQTELFQALREGVVRIEVRKGPNRPNTFGTGFVIAVKGKTVSILTARHILYPEKDEPPFTPDPWVIFYIDGQRTSRKAVRLPTDSPEYGMAVLQVSADGLDVTRLPRFWLRPDEMPLTTDDDVRMIGSGDATWPMPKLSISDLGYNARQDRFTYTGNGVGGGFSGSPVFDRNGLLIGIHQGVTEDGLGNLWAQKLTTTAVKALQPIAGAASPTQTAVVFNAPPSLTLEPDICPAQHPYAGAVCYNDDDFSFYMWVPPAPDGYMMGCSPMDGECSPNEKPAHLVKIANGFWLGRDEVKQEWFSRTMKNANPSRFKGDSLPVDSVTWDDANAFCRAYGGRLPTEEEWEYAARAGTTGARYGDAREGTLNDLAWYGSNSSGMTHKTHAKIPNAWGLDDMLGNLSEWTSTGAAASPEPAKNNCPGCKIVRGGSWSSPVNEVRASYRRAAATTSRDSTIGFRCIGTSNRR